MPNTPQIAVSPDNPCPFLRALVANGYVDGHIDYIRIYNDEMSVSSDYNPPAGYDYQWSGD